MLLLWITRRCLFTEKRCVNMKFLYFEKLETNKLYLENLKQVFRIKTNCHYHLAVAIKSRSTGGVVSPRSLPYRPTNHSLPFVWLKTPGILLWKKAVSPFSFKMKKMDFFFFELHQKVYTTSFTSKPYKKETRQTFSPFFFWIFFSDIMCLKCKWTFRPVGVSYTISKEKKNK